MIVRPANGPVQLQPPGLLGLLQLKVGGFVPDALLQSVQPTFDMMAFWLRSSMQFMPTPYTRTIGVSTPNQIEPFLDSATATLTLGPGSKEWWYVSSYAAQVWTGGVSPAKSDVRLGYTVTGGPLGGVSSIYLGDLVRVGAGDVLPIGAENFWLPPGAQLGVYVNDIPSNFVMELTGLRYVPCPI